MEHSSDKRVSMWTPVFVFLIITTTSTRTSVHGNIVETGNWVRLLSNGATVTADANVLVAKSVLHCNMACSQRRGCDSYCYDVTSRDCYVGGVLTSPLVVSVTNQLRCFRFMCTRTCPISAGYFLHGQNCIKVYDNMPRNYTEAGRVCAADGGHLYYLRTPDLTVAYYNIVMHQLNGLTWLGADAIDNNRHFRWSDGSHVFAEVWDVNQGDNYSGEQHCATHWQETTMKMHDGECYHLLPFICQIDC